MFKIIFIHKVAFCIFKLCKIYHKSDFGTELFSKLGHVEQKYVIFFWRKNCKKKYRKKYSRDGIGNIDTITLVVWSNISTTLKVFSLETFSFLFSDFLNKIISYKC